MDIESSYNLPHMYTDNEFFTENEAIGCRVISSKAVTIGGVHNHWIHVIKDKENNQYTVKDFATASDISEADQKQAILIHLMENCHKIRDNDNETQATASSRNANVTFLGTS